MLDCDGCKRIVGDGASDRFIYCHTCLGRFALALLDVGLRIGDEVLGGAITEQDAVDAVVVLIQGVQAHFGVSGEDAQKLLGPADGLRDVFDQVLSVVQRGAGESDDEKVRH